MEGRDVDVRLSLINQFSRYDGGEISHWQMIDTRRLASNFCVPAVDINQAAKRMLRLMTNGEPWEGMSYWRISQISKRSVLEELQMDTGPEGHVKPINILGAQILWSLDFSQ